uniref:Uncharacterized protein n=1 Tax=Ciona intestinalis TaxID=7719 RepID=H2XUW9_CIOIN
HFRNPLHLWRENQEVPITNTSNTQRPRKLSTRELNKFDNQGISKKL